MRSEFKVHMLNEEGKLKAQEIANIFDDCLSKLELLCVDVARGQNGEEILAPNREFNICRTKLEEACFFAKKAVAMRPVNQEIKAG